MYRSRSAIAFVLLASLASFSCSSSNAPTGPTITTGSITVAVATAGPDAPTAYMVALDGGTARRSERRPRPASRA